MRHLLPFGHSKLLVLTAFVALAINAMGCAAPAFEGGEDGEDEERGSSESSVVRAGGGACPVDARLSQGFHGKHDGIDLANRIGTPIFAIMGGKVTASGPAQGYGQWIRIEHTDGSMSEYGHMSRRLVQVGATVKAGQKIALVGSEGRSTGPHLHLRTYNSARRVGSGNGTSPIAFLQARGVSIPCKPNGTVAPAQEEVTGDNDASEETDGTVTTWKAGIVRQFPDLDADVVANVGARKTLDAECWTEGDTVTESQYSHDKWVEVTVDGKKGYIPGVYLRGDETGDVSKQCAGGINTL